MSWLDLLEDLLSITEGYIFPDSGEAADAETRAKWQMISAIVADMRDGEDI
jgi:hypothetical protein